MSVIIEKSVGKGGANRPVDTRAVKGRLIELGFDFLTPDQNVDNLTIHAIKLFQAIKNGFHRVEANLANDGRFDVGGDAIKWLNAVNAPRWQMMPRGSREEGFVNTEIEDTDDDHDFGTVLLAETIQAAGAAYAATFLSAHPDAAPLTINDTSRPQGGNTSSHEGHESGLSCDVRLPRKDGGAGGILTSSNQFDRPAMRAMLKAFHNQEMASRVFLIDSQLVNEGLCIAIPNHKNHAHFEIKPPARVPATN